VYRRWTFALIIDIFQWICICLLYLGIFYYSFEILSPLFVGHRSHAVTDVIWLGPGAFCILGSLFSGRSLFRAFRCRLVLTDRGIIRYGVFAQQFTPWSNILGIGCQGKEKGLRLKEPANCANLAEGLEKSVPTLVVNKGRWSVLDRYTNFFPIPKDISERDWENGLLGKYVRRYSSLNMDKFVKEELDVDAW
jgi:hypothetical protein